MTERVANCIYCSEVFDPRKGQGDHVLPVQFGVFRGDKRFRGCCSKCNNAIGKHEEQLIRCGPESEDLRKLRPSRPAKRARGNRSSIGAGGFSPPKNSTPIDGFEVPLFHDLHTGLKRTKEGLTLRLKSGEFAHIELHETTSAKWLDEELRQYGDIESCHFRAETQNLKRYMELVKSIRPECHVEPRDETPMGVSTVPVRIQIEVGTAYFRSIAKLAFHTYLLASHRSFSGGEAIFAPIREFVLRGDNVEDFIQHKTLNMPIPVRDWVSRIAPVSRLCHMVFIEDGPKEIIVGVKLFHGSELSNWRRLVIARYPVLVPARPRVLLAFVYDDPQQSSGSAGQVHQLIVP